MVPAWSTAACLCLCLNSRRRFAQEDPLVQASLLQHVAAPEERIILVKKIIDSSPRQPPELCRQLPEGDARTNARQVITYWLTRTAMTASDASEAVENATSTAVKPSRCS